ncbi:MAG: phospholipase D-like domain-containing protein [Halolamina sp.]
MSDQRRLSAALRALAAVALLVAAVVAPAGQATAAPAAAGSPVAAPEVYSESDADRHPADGNATASNGSIELAYPDPIADGDRGEFVVLGLPIAGNWTLRDGETVISVTAAEPGRVALAATPAAARNHTDARLVATPALSLANGGERLRLVRNGTVVDALSYGDAREGELRSADGWRPLGFDPRSPVALGSATITAFTLPDAPEVPVETVANAEDRLYLAGYTFASRAVVDELLAAAARGADVRVLLEGDPVGGLSAREAALLDELVAGGVAVRVVAGPRAPFSYHHAKYAVADDRAVVLTENWKPSGTGGRSNRGWGVRAGAATAAELGELFRSDFEGPGTVPWASLREDRTFAAEDPAADGDRRGEYPEEFAPASVDAERIRLLTAPGNARGTMVNLVADADGRIAVLQPTLGGTRTPLVKAVVAAADRGVRVRVLLSGAWYVAEQNRRLVATLNDLAERRNLSLTARVADPSGRYGKVHAKGLLVDDAVVVGSLNWNRHSATENREVALALRGAEPAAYFRRTFEADWRASDLDGDGSFAGVGDRLPLDLLAGAVGAAVLAALTLSRTVDFEERLGPGAEP